MGRSKRQRCKSPGMGALGASKPNHSGSTFSWKDHPVVVAALSVAGTFTLTTFAFKEVIIPTQLADINNKIRDLPSLQSTIETLQVDGKRKDQEIDSLKRQVELLQQKNLFNRGDPMPVVLSKVKIGQPIVDIDLFYPSRMVDKSSESYWSVNLDYGVFREIVYFYDEKKKKKTVTHISFRMAPQADYSEAFLQDRLIDALGPPASNPRKDFFSWETKNYSVFKISNDSYLVLPRESRPGYWPD